MGAGSDFLKKIKDLYDAAMAPIKPNASTPHMTQENIDRGAMDEELPLEEKNKKKKGSATRALQEQW